MATEEEELLSAFRAMDGRSKGYILRLAKSQAIDCPASAVTHLRLATANFRGGSLGGVVRSTHDVALAVVRRPSE